MSKLSQNAGPENALNAERKGTGKENAEARVKEMERQKKKARL